MAREAGECVSRHYFQQLSEVEKGLATLIRAGLGPGNYAYETLYKVRGSILGKLRLALPTPRLPTLLKLLPMLSPGELKVFFDNEVGWIAEGTPEPGMPPTLRHISHKEAELLLSASPPPDLVHRLLEPDSYIGE